MKGYVHVVCRSVQCYLFVEIKVDYTLEWFWDIVIPVYQILNILPPVNDQVTVRHQVLLLCTVAKVGLQIYFWCTSVLFSPFPCVVPHYCQWFVLQLVFLPCI